MQVLQKGERLDDIGFGGLKLIQKPDEFCYGVDAVILADFAAGGGRPTDAKAGKKAKKAIDLGTGTGIIPLILSHKTDIAEIYGLEVQEASYERALRTVEANNLSARIKLLKGDVSDFMLGNGKTHAGSFDMVLTNPPYVAKGTGIENNSCAKLVARQETTAGIEDFIFAASRLLKEKGDFYMVHRPSRLPDIILSMHAHSIEPKEMRFVSPNANKAPNIILIHGIKGGRRSLRILDPLFIYNIDGGYSKEIHRIYEREKLIE